MARGIHPKKEVRKALKELRAAGWTIEAAVGGHAHRWGTATCPHQHPDGSGGVIRCVQGIRSTPRNEGNHARELRRALRWCEEWLAHSALQEQTDV